ncbi:MAG TPA: MFS transporter [Beijerinckiaceae bacterium]|nr:MFS transporter [Beijerinckiaceae bacterium]
MSHLVAPVPSRSPSETSFTAVAFFASAATTFFASSSAPTPLYRHYQELFGFSPAILTVIFASYAFPLLAALLIVGSLSDFVGRRPIVFVALILNALAMAAFITADSVGALMLARAIQGLATGMATTALGAALLDHHKTRGALLGSLTVFVGLTIGALGSGALFSFAQAPIWVVYALLLAVSLVEALLLWLMPETVALRTGAFASLRPRISIPLQARRKLLQVSPVNIAAWALGAFYLSLMPSIFGIATGLTSPFVGSTIVAALTIAATLVAITTRDHAPQKILSIGAPLLAIGVIATLVGIHAQFVSLMIVGTFIAGAGMGSAFSGAARTVLPLAAPGERAGLLSAFYVESYLAYSLPTTAAGFSVPILGLSLVTYIYGTALVVLAVATMAALREPAPRRVAMDAP